MMASLLELHMRMPKATIQNLGDGSRQITEQCRTTQVADGSWTAITTSYTVLSRTAFIGATPFGKTSYRFCKQTDLPEPWGTNDLRAYGIK